MKELSTSGGSGIVVGVIVRNGHAFVPRAEDQVQQGDDVYVITETDRVDRVMAFLGHEAQVARRIVIVGGGNVGLNLATRIARHAPYVSLKMVEHSRERAELISRELRDAAVVIQGDALDKEVLLEANVQSADTIIAVTNDDETNIFASVLAKREGCTRAITLVNKTSYEHVLPALGIDAVVSPSAITISTILRHVRHRSVSALYTLREDFGEVIQATAQEGSRLVKGTLREAGMPDGMLIGAIVRNGEVIIPTSSTRVHPGDSIIAVVAYRALRKAEAILAGPSAETGE
jgi:trk system potassium uptake protein TrkA